MSRSRRVAVVVCLFALIFGCTAESEPPLSTSVLPNRSTTTATGAALPAVSGVSAVPDPSAYEMVEMVVDVSAEYGNPFDQREVRLDARFTAPDGSSLVIPGFWDGEEAWKLRFTPTSHGRWGYEVTVTDHRGVSEPFLGFVSVEPSDHPGFIRVGDQVDPEYSPRYFAYEDGTPWYGRGHADLDMSLGGADPGGEGLDKFTEMAETGENYEMWWPMWGNNFIQSSYDDYAPAQMNIIDFVVRDAEEKGIALVYTIWSHQFLRTPSHEWPDERWSFNGFSELTDIEGFFGNPQAWAWQENYYRYVIARWSYSSAILMWQTVTEINGTESYDRTDTWHEKVNDYFVENDPYGHSTTATKSGAEDWPRGHAVMDAPQVHLYHIFGENPIADGAHFAEWTSLMWEREEKPNWIGEYGNRVQRLYPEFMHNANWTSLATGAAMTPTEWNDGNAFGTFDDEMRADMRRFSDFVEEVPLAAYDPEAVSVTFNDPEVRGWGVVGETGGLIWVQDFALDDGTIEEIRADESVRTDVVAVVDDLAAGSWKVTPYDTWQGTWLPTLEVDCPGGACELSLPDFHSDLAIHLEG